MDQSGLRLFPGFAWVALRVPPHSEYLLTEIAKVYFAFYVRRYDKKLTATALDVHDARIADVKMAMKRKI